MKLPNDIGFGFMIYFLKTFIILFVPICLLFIFIWGKVQGVIYAGFVSLIATFITIIITNTIGDVSKLLYGGGKANISLRELMQGRLKAVRFAITKKNFKTALGIVNEILDKDPEFYEAIFVKAQILDQGFSRTISAEKYARKVLDNTPKGENIHTWASSLYDELSLKAERE
jgi:hypothetical protein